MLVLDRINVRWSLDFVSAAFTDGRLFWEEAGIPSFAFARLRGVFDGSGDPERFRRFRAAFPRLSLRAEACTWTGLLDKHASLYAI
ncbi:MAG: hypothetical protein ABII76_29015 [Pseudomonadota bacterium]